jgi:hypothetical protein
VTAGQVQLIGHGVAPDATDLDRIGVILAGQDAEITATGAIFVQGAGDAGVAIDSGVRLALAGGGSGSVVIDGAGGAREGVGIYAWDVDTDTIGRGTRLTVAGGQLAVTGRTLFGSLGVLLDNTLGAPGPLLDLAAAGAGTSAIGADADGSLLVVGVDIVTPTAGVLVLQAQGPLSLSEVFVSGAGGTLSLSGQGIDIDTSVFTSASGPLNLDFDAVGSGTPTGLRLNNTIIETRGGDVVFGGLRTVSSPILGSTTTPGFWIETDSSDSAAALLISDSAIDAGSGRIAGGGAVGGSGFDVPGLVLFRSVLDAARI